MNGVLGIAASSMNEGQARLATISHNLANATTAGYKREITVGRAFADHLQAAGADATRVFATSLPVATSAIDMRAGTLRATGNPLDVALEGEGFFELQGPEGAVYTRQGTFGIDARGRLVHASGLPAAGEITLAGGQPRIDAQGNVFEDDKPAGKLRVVAFERPAALARLGEGLYGAPAEAAPLAANARVRQGWLENSNVTTAREMVGLIETVRHFEANQRLIQSWDELLGRTIRTLGEF
jgi:flagellar basal-body rod protein FlgG